MSTFFTPKFLAFILLLITQPGVIPSDALGKWKVGLPYYLGQSIGLTSKQEEQIKHLSINITPDRIDVCGKHLSIEAVEIHQLSSSDFMQKFNFKPELLEFKANAITEISINPLHTISVCHGFTDPGTHFFIADKHIVIEVNNDYFPLKPVN